MDLFDGEGLAGWDHVGEGGFDVVDGALEARGGMGLLWYREHQFADFVLDLEWRTTSLTDNGGVFVRFPDPRGDVWNPVHQGYEVQILDDPGAGDRSTSAIYTFAAPAERRSRPPGQWNHYEIQVTGQDYSVSLNGGVVTRFRGDRALRGHVGIQNHDEHSPVQYRAIRVTELGPPRPIAARRRVGWRFASSSSSSGGVSLSGARRSRTSPRRWRSCPCRPPGCG